MKRTTEMINGIDFDARLEELRMNLHAAIIYRFGGYFPIDFVVTHFNSSSTYTPITQNVSWADATWIKFDHP